MPIATTPSPPARVRNRQTFVAFVFDGRNEYPTVRLYPYLKLFVQKRFKEVPERISPELFKSYLTELFGPVTGHWLYANMYEGMPTERFIITLTEAADNRETPSTEYVPPEPPTPSKPTDMTVDHLYARQLHRELERSNREDFAEYLNKRRGPVNPIRIYRQWIKSLGSQLHARWKKDCLERLGQRATAIIETSPIVRRKQLAQLIKDLQ